MNYSPTASDFFQQIPVLSYVTPQQINSRRIRRSIHRHSDIAEILFVYHGEGQFICDGYTFPLSAGDVILCNQNCMHEVQSASELEIGTYCFGFSNFQLRGGQEPGILTAPEQGYVRSCGDHFHEIHQLCRMIYHLITQDTPLCRAAAQELFLGLVLTALSLPSDGRTGEQNHKAVLAARIQQYIILHYKDPLTLESISEALNMSVYYAAHIFKQEFGISPIQFMIDCRIGEAQNLLISSDYSAVQIATMVGYNSAYHFSAIFKRKVGMAPIAYRRHYLEQMRGKRAQ